MLGEDTFRLRTPVEDFLVRFNRFAGPPNVEQAALARRCMSALRFGVEGQDPGIVATAQQIVQVLDGGGTFGLFGLRELGPSLIDAQFATQLLRRLEDELERGRLVVEREQIAPLTDRRDISLPDLPPLPPPRREPSTQTFEIRFIDEIGKAISGIDAEFTADGAQTRPTNAAGIALLEGVQATSATVSLLDVEALSQVLDPRWEKHRPGAPPKESNTTEVVFRGAELGPFPLKAELPNTVVVKPPLGKLFVELWDKTGRVRHANRTYQISGPQTFEGKTDEDGRLLHEDVFPGDYQLSLALELFEEGDPDRQIDIVDSPLVVLDSADGAAQVRLLGAVPRSVLARLHLFFNTNKVFLLPTALPSVTKLRRLYLDNAPCQLLVVGHADTRGSTAYNDQLSLERAEATIAYLKDDVEGWFKFYGEGIDQKKRWGKTEDQLMLRSMFDFKTKSRGEDAVSWYQRTRGLQVDGDAGKETRRALIKEYMELDGASLTDFVGDIDATAHGCGENFPLQDEGEELDPTPADEKRDPIDRRVELFFFDNEFGITPPPPGPNSKPGSIEYPLWRKRATEIVDLTVDSEGNKLQLLELEDVLFDTNSAVPSPGRCQSAAEGSSAAAPSAVLDVAAALRYAYLQPHKLLLVAGHTDTTADEAINDPLSEKRARTVLALLVGDRDAFRNTCNEQSVGADRVRVLEWAASCFGFDCDPKAHNQNLDRAIRALQRDYNTTGKGGNPDALELNVDGDFGPLTWGAVFDLYESRMAELLKGDRELLGEYRKGLKFVDDEKRHLGFGERYPIDELGQDNFRSQSNRRVEILFFEPDARPDLDAPLDASDIYLPGIFVREHLPLDPELLEILPTKAARLPTRYSNGKTFPKPSALPVLGEIARLAAEGRSRIVIVGHTDHSEKNDTNTQLALARAEAVAALLRQDADFFRRRFDEPDPLKPWNWEEVQWMLSAVRVGSERCYVGFVDDCPGDVTRQALGTFQLHSGELEVDYGCDDGTLRSLIERYFQLLGAPPVLDDVITVVAGGSWHPPRRFGTGALEDDLGGELSSANRRVDVFVFDQPVTPEPTSVVPETRQESPTYIRWCQSSTLELPASEGAFPIRLFDAKLVPLAGVSVAIARCVAESDELEPFATLTSSPFGSLELAGPLGSYQLTFTVQGRLHSFALSLHPDEVGGFAAIIPYGLG